MPIELLAEVSRKIALTFLAKLLPSSSETTSS
jgi:hypothetical protein